LTLTAGVARDVGPTKTAEITAATQQLLLRLTLEDGDYPSYRAELKTAEGKDIWDQAKLRSRRTAYGKALLVSVAAKPLVSDDYILTLHGLSRDGDYERVGTYHFRVVRK
jgi:methionine-rich copper-binding protein CopC